MAFELYGMLAGSVSPVTGETVKPAYGGNDEAFLTKVVTPIYNTIAKVICCNLFPQVLHIEPQAALGWLKNLYNYSWAL